MNKRPSFKPHELAHDVAALFRNPNVNDMKPVKFSMEKSIKILQAVRPTSLDLTDPDQGIPFALEFVIGSYPEKVKSAGCLLRLCLHVIERGETTEFDRQNIPLHLAALSGYVPDQSSYNAKKKRPKRGEDALNRGIKESLIAKPHANWQERAYWLKNEGIVTEFNSETLEFTNGVTSKTINIMTFKNRITKLRKK